MATIKRFEELTIWQDARELCKRVHDIAVNTNLVKDLWVKPDLKFIDPKIPK